MTTNTSYETNLNSPFDLVDAVNAQSNNLFAVGIVVVVGFIIYQRLTENNYGLDDIMIYGGMAEILLCLIFFLLHWLAFYWIMFACFILLIGIILRVQNR